MMDLSIAVACLIVYIKKHKNSCSHLDVLSEKIRIEVEKQINQNESLHEKVKEDKDDLENYKLQLHILTKSKEDLELELEEVRRQNLMYEKKQEHIFEDNKRLNEKVEQLEINNSVLIDRHKKEMEKQVNVKKRNNHHHITEQTRLKSYISKLEIKTKEYQDKVIGMKLKCEKEVQATERKMHQLQVHLQEKKERIMQKDEVITSNERKIKYQCAEIDHLREQIKDMEVKNDFLRAKEHEISKMSEEKQILERKNEELFDEMEKVTETLCKTDARLGAVLSSLKIDMVSLTTCEDDNCTRYKHETHMQKTSDWKEVAYSIKNKIDHLQGNIYGLNIKSNSYEDTNVCDKYHSPMKSEHVNFMQQPVETQTELNELHELLNKKEHELSKLTDDKMCLQNTIEQNEILLQQFREKLNHMQKRYQDKTETVNSTEKMNADLAKECDNLRDRLKKKEMYITQLKEDIYKNLSHYEERESKYQHDLTQLRSELREKGVQLSRLNDQLIEGESAKTDHVLNAQELLKYKDKLIESEEQLKNIQNEHCQLKTKYEDLENELRKKEGELTKREMERDQILKKMKESDELVILMQKKIQELERDAVQNNQTKTDIDRQLEDLNERQTLLLSEKDRIISELNKTMILLNQTISDLKETEKSLKLDQRNREEHISTLNDKLKKYTHLVNKNESKVRDMEKTLQTEKNEFENKLQFYENEIARKDKMADEINDRMGKMESRAIALGKELKERDAKIDELDAQLQQIQKHQDDTQKNLENVINSKQKLILHLQKDVEQRNSKISSLEKKNAQESLENLSGGEHKIDVAVTNEIKELKRQLKLTMSKLHDTEAELDDTKTRLSKAMGDRLTDNNPNITDLSDRNRPTKLAEKCAELYDNQWTDAFEILETYFPNDEAVIEALLHILQVTMTFCQEKAQYQMDELGRTLTFADRNANADQSLSVYKQLKDTRKATALSAVKNLREMFISYLRQTADQTVSRALEIKDFTFECLEMCWLMLVNDPPVAFAPLLAKGTHFNSDLYKPYTTNGSHVEYVVWPALLLHKGGPILAKGVAQGINKSKKSTKHKKSMSNKQF
ncbi:myosin heavy chain, muscle-like [Ruditapes philippinarum]|uniref:myosin heavy chain, muscle-like n=1 Tax=Ruditapes philippinarum TaxID=129788 RepID=UPI00295A8C16|nr:myosin heavy chain, muscle-like [Ruditapes philippinarum]